jgi:DNA-binding Lrp family transcriptional regulator
VKDTLLDQKDHDILRALKRNSRKTVAELSKELGIPRATVHERIMKLGKRGVIKRFTIEQDYDKMGLPTMAFISITYDSTIKLNQLTQKLSNIEGILGVYVVSGEWGILLKIRGKSIEDIGNLIVSKIMKIPGITRTKTLACFEVTKDES